MVSFSCLQFPAPKLIDRNAIGFDPQILCEFPQNCWTRTQNGANFQPRHFDLKCWFFFLKKHPILCNIRKIPKIVWSLSLVYYTKVRRIREDFSSKFRSVNNGWSARAQTKHIHERNNWCDVVYFPHQRRSGCSSIFYSLPLLSSRIREKISKIQLT